MKSTIDRLVMPIFLSDNGKEGQPLPRTQFMVPADIQSHIRPFAPFRIVTASGETYDVRSPDLIMVGIGSVVIGIPPKPDDDIFERTVRVSLFQIERIEQLPVKTKDGNGQG
jgi:hypothetical protein